jgi:hypothetical protein
LLAIIALPSLVRFGREVITERLQLRLQVQQPSSILTPPSDNDKRNFINFFFRPAVNYVLQSL